MVRQRGCQGLAVQAREKSSTHTPVSVIHFCLGGLPKPAFAPYTDGDLMLQA